MWKKIWSGIRSALKSSIPYFLKEMPWALKKSKGAFTWRVVFNVKFKNSRLKYMNIKLRTFMPLNQCCFVIGTHFYSCTSILEKTQITFVSVRMNWFLVCFGRSSFKAGCLIQTLRIKGCLFEEIWQSNNKPYLVCVESWCWENQNDSKIYH